MSRSKSNYKVYNGKKLKEFFQNSRILVLTVLFIIGIILGALFIKMNNDIYKELEKYVESYMYVKTGQGIWEIFCNSMLSNITFLASSLFLAFSLIGYPIIIWVPFLRGLGFGAVCGFLYLNYKLSGFGYSILTILPGATLSSFALISVCNFGCEYSKNAFLKSVSGKGVFEKGETKILLVRHFVLSVICLFSSLFDAVLSYAFLRFFEF